MEELSLSYLIKLAFKNIKVLIITALCVAVASTTLGFLLLRPTYTATHELMVSTQPFADPDNISGGLNNADIIASLNIAVTTQELLQSDGLLNQLAEKLGNGYTAEQLKDRQTITRSSESALIFEVSFLGASEEESVNITSEYMQLAPGFVKEFIPSAHLVPIDPSSIKENASFGLKEIFAITAFGVALAYMIILFKEQNTPIIRDEYKFVNNFDLEIIGRVPQYSLTGDSDNN